MKKILLGLIGVVTALMLVSCGGAAPAATPGTPDATVAANLTKQLEGVTLNEYAFGDQFLKVEEIKTVDAKVKAVVSSEDFKKITKKGYYLYAVGHACKWGSPSANKAMGMQRAKQTINELRGLGLDVKFVKPASLGDKKMQKDQSTQHPAQRRVTFMVTKTVK